MANNTMLMKKRDISQARNEIYQLLTSKEYKESCMLFEQEVKKSKNIQAMLSEIKSKKYKDKIIYCAGKLKEYYDILSNDKNNEIQTEYIFVKEIFMDLLMETTMKNNSIERIELPYVDCKKNMIFILDKIIEYTESTSDDLLLTAIYNTYFDLVILFTNEYL